MHRQWKRRCTAVPSVWAAVALVPLLFWYVRDAWAANAWEAGGAVTLTLAFIAPVCAGLAAWEARRLTVAEVHRTAPVRSALRIACDRLTPVLALGAGALAVTTVFVFARTGHLPGAGIAAVWCAVVVSHVLAAFVFARAVPNTLGVAAPVLLSWVVIAYPPSMSPDWLRHLTGGGLHTCCAADSVVAPQALIGPLLLGAGTAVAAGIAVAAGRRLLAVALALAVAGASLVGAVHLVRDVPATPSAPRAVEELHCAGTEPELCLWPEEESRRAWLRQSLSTAYDALAEVGISPPARIGSMRWDERTTPLYAGEDVTTGLVAQDVSAGVLPEREPDCAAESEDYYGGEVYAALVLWLVFTASGSDAPPEEAIWPSEDVELAQQVVRRPPHEQRAWYQHNRRALTTCGVEPLLTADAPPRA
ncbi:DUF7224 domain-containing protein [Streptomyces otsuchiensis]|uniref:DUF7224 domain-containing protein n=1 Tax=Streptomyces otsuchiensis TaxID=2681388 RepID=UPI001030BB67|nr:hypothetical protein [Streptomyces otsuchiensis]